MHQAGVLLTSSGVYVTLLNKRRVLLCFQKSCQSTLLRYWNEKVIGGKKCVSYDGSPPITSVIRSRATFDEFMDKLYNVTVYEKQYTHLAV